MQEEEINLTETIDKFRRIAVRYRWAVLLPTVVAGLVASSYAWLLPDRYSSEATLVKHQPISQHYVLPANMVTNAEDVDATAREILTRPLLLKIIDQFNLYSKEKSAGAPPEALAALLVRDISVQSLDPARPSMTSSAFKIAFTADGPELAQAVTSRLTQLFIDQSLRIRENTAERTTNFLKEQVAAAKKTLVDQEQRLQDFKARYLGELPEQQQINLLALTELRAQLQTTLTSLSRAKQLAATLGSQLSSILSRLQSEKTALLTRYTARHPDVIRKDQEITTTQTAISQLGGPSTGDKQSSLAAPSDPALAELLRQAETASHEVDTLSKEEARLQSEIGRYQGHLNLTPVREQQLNALVRDYDLIKHDYSDLLNRQLQSQLATTVEERGEGSQFRLVDPPTLPVRPSSPKRLKVSLGGAAAGLAAGVALVFLIGFLDQSFHSEKEINRHFALPFVLGVPYLLTPKDRGVRRWKMVAEWTTASVMILAVAMAEFLIYRRG
jgi:polysaccharide biosynthesis transport protein